MIYDVLGDVVCGGFSMPLRKQYADAVFIVTSGEKMSIFAAQNIAIALDSFKNRGYAQLGGVILNRRDVKDEYEIVEDFARDVESKIIADIPRSPLISQADEQNKTVVEAFPDSDIAGIYKKLAEDILKEVADGQ